MSHKTIISDLSVRKRDYFCFKYKYSATYHILPYLGGGGALDMGWSSASDSRLLNRALALAVELLARRTASCQNIIGR